MGRGGRREEWEYTRIKAEIFYGSSRGKNGVRPCKGEIFSQSMKVECARKIRKYPLGTKIIIDVVETDREGGKPFLYSSYRWAYEVLEGE